MITILKRPSKYSPVYNPSYWQFKTDKSNILSFKLRVIDHSNAGIISTQLLYPTPKFISGSYFDISKIMLNYLTWEINNDPVKLIVPLSKSVKAYTVEITEQLLVEGNIVDGDSWNNASDPCFVWRSELGRIEFNSYSQVKYLINPTGLSSFLTNAPNFKLTTDISAEHLYFLQDNSVPDLKVRIRTYSGNGILIKTEIESIPSLDQFKMFRLNISPKALNEYFNLKFDNVKYYTVDLVDGLFNPKTTERVYLYEKSNCSLEYVNVLWENRLGGFDSYSFVAPSDQIDVARTILKKNIYQLDSNDVYTDIRDQVYNPSEVIINSSQELSTKLHSLQLTDAEGLWLAELYSSKQVFVELGDGALVPVMLMNNSYQIPRTKYRKNEPNTISIDIKMGEGIIPAKAQGYSDRKGNIDFIDSQMNSIGSGLPGWGINPHTQPSEYDDSDYGPDYA
ncbi:MAG: hypothetical protein ABW007_04060 [Chitinophagaceae bacterium]